MNISDIHLFNKNNNTINNIYTLIVFFLWKHLNRFEHISQLQQMILQWKKIKFVPFGVISSNDYHSYIFKI